MESMRLFVFLFVVAIVQGTGACGEAKRWDFSMRDVRDRNFVLTDAERDELGALARGVPEELRARFDALYPECAVRAQKEYGDTGNGRKYPSMYYADLKAKVFGPILDLGDAVIPLALEKAIAMPGADKPTQTLEDGEIAYGLVKALTGQDLGFEIMGWWTPHDARSRCYAKLWLKERREAGEGGAP